jgi:hypothetical protein
MEGIDLESLSVSADDDGIDQVMEMNEIEHITTNEHAERINAHKRNWNNLKSRVYSRHERVEVFYTQLEALQYSARSGDLRGTFFQTLNPKYSPKNI